MDGLDKTLQQWAEMDEDSRADALAVLFAANPTIEAKHYEDRLLEAPEINGLTPAMLSEYGVDAADQEWVLRAIGAPSGSVVLLGDANCGKVAGSRALLLIDTGGGR